MLVGPTPKAAPKPGLFETKKPLSRQDLRQSLRKDTGQIPGTSRKFSFKEREGMEKGIFNYKKYGGRISEQDFKGAIGDLEKNRRLSKSYAERSKIQDKISYLRRLKGEK
ncbi:MAG: hypothetical protein A2562_03300 [Candidatus Nealsonbacteria bacterium RIFOXYD1_FULL_39_11]|nr:MAG: hypothetical protein A2562_03300 [Candidatus Nealsonbacteria bacterium RIFOXYD1_FULL_39_11]